MLVYATRNSRTDVTDLGHLEDDRRLGIASSFESCDNSRRRRNVDLEVTHQHSSPTPYIRDTYRRDRITLLLAVLEQGEDIIANDDLQHISSTSLSTSREQLTPVLRLRTSLAPMIAVVSVMCLSGEESEVVEECLRDLGRQAGRGDPTLLTS
jgi:hypothetical protein